MPAGFHLLAFFAQSRALVVTDPGIARAVGD